MSLDLSARLVVGVASSALFDLSVSHAIFEEEGLEAFRAHQRELLDDPFPPGVAFAFVERLLALNALRPDDPLVEVVLLSRNDAETGRRAFRAIEHYGLAIERAAFLQGESPRDYLPAFDCELFLSANEADVRAAIAAGQPAGYVIGPGAAAADAPDEPDEPDADDGALRVAFDFDGVLADDGSEAIYASQGIDAFRAHETARQAEPLAAGPLKPLLDRLAAIQKLERGVAAGSRRLKIALVTARGAPAHERVISTLESWGVALDQVFFLGGVEKTEILRRLRPHIYFDDQRVHLDRAALIAPSVHIPFGVKNRTKGEPDSA